MKRREFFRGAAGVASVVLPTVGKVAAPCMPNFFQIAGGSSITSTCREIPPGDAPAWFTNLPAGQWGAVAGGTGTRLVDCVYRPYITNGTGNYAGSPSSITAAWTGGAVDQGRGEYLLCANGGHGDYSGNECYAISVRDATPRWRRLTDPTPQSHVLFDNNPGPRGAVNADGRPRSMHSTFQTYGDGRVWFPEQNSFASPGGGTVHAVISFNRDSLGTGSTPQPWTAANLGPWTLHEPPNFGPFDATSTLFGRADWDRVGHKVWAVGGNNNVFSGFYWSVNTSGANIGQSTVYRKEPLDNFNSWIAIAHDLRILIAAGTHYNKIWILHLDRVGQANDWEAVSNVSGSAFFEGGAGAVYVKANASLAIANPKSTGSSFYKLKIPTKLVGGQVQYDPSGTWAWSLREPGGVPVTVPANGGNNHVYSKWNIVEDMGNGQSAIVVQTDIGLPLYVYKIQASGL
jgi:hypothetical protein